MQRIAEFTARCEKYVGTESGGMDQAISIMGEKGLAKLVHFKPVRPPIMVTRRKQSLQGYVLQERCNTLHRIYVLDTETGPCCCYSIATWGTSPTPGHLLHHHLTTDSAL